MELKNINSITLNYTEYFHCSNTHFCLTNNLKNNENYIEDSEDLIMLNIKKK